jgi:hypothetical protein
MYPQRRKTMDRLKDALFFGSVADPVERAAEGFRTIDARLA